MWRTAIAAAHINIVVGEKVAPGADDGVATAHYVLSVAATNAASVGATAASYAVGAVVTCGVASRMVGMHGATDIAVGAATTISVVETVYLGPHGLYDSHIGLMTEHANVAKRYSREMSGDYMQ